MPIFPPQIPHWFSQNWSHPFLCEFYLVVLICTNQLARSGRSLEHPQTKCVKWYQESNMKYVWRLFVKPHSLGHKNQLVTCCKDKSVPLQAWSGPEGSRKLRFPDFMTTSQDCGKVVSLTHRPPLPSGNTPGTHFSLRLSRPQGHSAIGRILCRRKIPIPPAGIEPATFRFVAQHLKPQCYRGITCCMEKNSCWNIWKIWISRNSTPIWTKNKKNSD